MKTESVKHHEYPDISTIYVIICLLFIVIYALYPVIKNRRCDEIKKQSIATISMQEKKICNIK